MANYIFPSLEDVKRMLRNLRFCVEKNYAHLVHMESHVPCKSNGRDVLDPLAPMERF